MIQFGSLHLQALSGIGMLVMALFAVFVRSRAGRRPVTTAAIVIPPLGMSTGFLMFFSPYFRLPASWTLIALGAGAVLFSYPLIYSSKLERREGGIYVRRSKMFMFVLLGLLCLRVALHTYIERYVSIPQTGALFFLLAFGSIVPWRLSMLKQYRRLRGDAIKL
ncbi:MULTISPECIES: CcdC family protein [Paenibacillus]|uniref:CcdC family protein n=1 Tax=Paenibacillus TaxID=44249 RepID=UPI0022B8683A|nr:cytochrome c biogenesis protein CcdC [Paenibacillus caseinilyticus]MCZ8522574.1 cytochrome c biogenesis protein CcdC [Paenibacillus caseinilyticus]